ncbi:PAS domain-containing protein [Tunturiibacter empetritectus]|uniref:PAS domain-containing protein n=1 Tax=Tunturiibacter empetritectus TaxID=3069691 RepID=UPI003D9B4BC9
MYDGVPVGLCFVDRNLRYVSVNKRLAGMHHLPVAAHLGRYISEVMPSVFPSASPICCAPSMDKPATTSKSATRTPIPSTKNALISSPSTPPATRPMRSSESPSPSSISPAASRPNKPSPKAKTTTAIQSSSTPRSPGPPTPKA